MEPTTEDPIQPIVTKETWTFEDYKELLERSIAQGDAPKRLPAILTQLEGETDEIKGTAALKIGMLRYMLGRFGESLQALNAATDNSDRHYFQGMCCKNLRQYPKATEEFERARDRGWDSMEIDLRIIEVRALSGDLDSASKALSKIAAKVGETSEFYYLRGLVEEFTGNGEAACEAYDKARSIDPEHVAATFRLAYYCDLHGEELEAVELYKECLTHPPVHANALLNLAVLYEDAGQYNQATTCLKRILISNPNHARAKLFLKDAQASKTMYYDEDQAKRIARRNAVLDIPVTDFELSVRARNCLKKMNIRTLGDLVNISEIELLSYKNFGETSLKEIKDMLTAKNLYLGQALEENGDLPAEVRAQDPPASSENEGAMGALIEQIEFSVRARRALKGLGIQTLGELAAKSEVELMSCRNFGQTSLNEVRQRLGEYGLQLRQAN